MVSNGEIDDPALEGPIYSLACACYAATDPHTCRTHPAPATFWTDPWAIKPRSSDAGGAGGAGGGGSAGGSPDCTGCGRFFGNPDRFAPDYGLCSTCAVNAAGTLPEVPAEELAARRRREEAQRMHQNGTAHFVSRTLRRPELAGLSESAREQLSYELGSDNMRQLIRCRRSFVAHSEWLKRHREVLEAAEPDEAAVETGLDRLREIEAKRPKHGPSVGVRTYAYDEQPLVEAVDHLRDECLGEYRRLLHADDEDESEVELDSD